METTKIIMIAAAIICVLDLVTIPLRRNYLEKRFGKLEIQIPNKSNFYKALITILCCFALIAILWFRKFDLFAVIILSCCSVLGIELSVRDLTTYKKNGVYSNAIVCDGQIIKFADILSFPLLNLSKEDFDAYSQSVLIIQTKTKGAKSIIFQTAEECKSIVKQIQELHPQFKA